eukprot:620609-Rhodomonas_salina.1
MRLRRSDAYVIRRYYTKSGTGVGLCPVNEEAARLWIVHFVGGLREQLQCSRTAVRARKAVSGTFARMVLLSGTSSTYGTISRRCYTSTQTLVLSAICLCARYEMSGTDVCYA